MDESTQKMIHPSLANEDGTDLNSSKQAAMLSTFSVASSIDRSKRVSSTSGQQDANMQVHVAQIFGTLSIPCW